MKEFDTSVNNRMDDENFVINPSEENAFFIDDFDETYEPTNDENGDNRHSVEVDDILPTDKPTEDAYDEILNAEVMVKIGDDSVLGKVVKRIRDKDGKPVGRRSDQPFLDTREYEVRLPDGATRELTYNQIALNIFSQCDTEGRRYQLLNEIVDHRKDDTALSKDDGWFVTKQGTRRRRLTTRGWSLLCVWKDGSSDWITLRELKNSHPVELAEYAQERGLNEEPAFAWWTSTALKKRDKMISRVKSRYWKTTHKLGIRLPKSVQEAFELDRLNGNDFWRAAIEKEMSKARVAFQRLDGYTPDDVRANKALVGYQETKGHWIFDIKMDGKFTRKARFVAGGHLIDAPSSLTYSTVVTRESVRIAFMLAALNGLDIKCADISNAYLNAPTREKCWIVAGPEFGSDEGSVMIVTRAWYGLKSSGAAWHAMLSQTMSDLGYRRCKADYDVWLRPAQKDDGSDYYEYVLIFVDDILITSHNPYATMGPLSKFYELKGDAVVTPDRYLGGNVGQYTLPDGNICWYTSAEDYLKSALINVEKTLENEGRALATGKSAERPYPDRYKPEVDITVELSDTLVNRYQQYIGILRWAVELGRLDIHFEVSKLASFTINPRRGHMEAVYSIFAYLKKHLRSKIVFDPAYVEIDESVFFQGNWDDYYGECKEDVPLVRPQPRGRAVVISMFCDADHAGNLLTRRSHTGLLIYLNNSIIDWYSKSQATVESSTFGSETIALRTGIDKLQALRYKLYMMGVPIEGAANIFCDNKSVCNTAREPDARLNKKHNAINFHRIREAVAAGWCRVAYEPGETNLADFFTKILPTSRRREILRQLLH